MGKNKLRRFAEMQEFTNVVEAGVDHFKDDNFPLKGRWASDFFKNDKPITLELACGKGEYAVALGRINRDRNYIGIDIKGARMFVGAKQALEEGLENVAFLRTRIDFIESMFGKDEIDEIWITFPDPQMKKNRARKRLTGPEFLARYRKFLRPEGRIHLKTDSRFLYDFTIETLEAEKMDVHHDEPEVYSHLDRLPKSVAQALDIKTHYEAVFTEQGHVITYLQFSFP